MQPQGNWGGGQQQGGYGSQMSFNQGQQGQGGYPPQQGGYQQPQQQPYGGSQMSFQGQQQGGYPPQQQQQYGSQMGFQGQQPAPSQYGQSQVSMVNDKFDQQNLNQYGGHKFGAYGSNLNFDNSAVVDSQRNLGQQSLQNQSMTESQMSLQDPDRKMKLKPLKWEKPLKKGKTKTQIFIWGKARPPNMFPASSDQLTPYHVDNLSKKKIWDVCAAREGHHCLGIGQNDWCFVWGETKQVGALGLGTNARATTPFLVRALRKQRVKQACCSAIHSLCITDQFVIYGWGSKIGRAHV